jgi:hypothetical protein
MSDYVARLPDLPQNIADTLDPKTMATRISADHPAPVKEPIAPLAPCCGSTDTKSLKVNFAYTKCAPLEDFIVARSENLVFFEAGQGGGPSGPRPASFKAYKLRELNKRTVFDKVVCVTSEGPWNAMLTEERFCNGYIPHRTLIINAFGNLVQFVWNGGIENHPPQVQLVSCRQVSLIRYPCGGISDCTCDSSVCPQEQPCDCSLGGQW